MKKNVKVPVHSNDGKLVGYDVIDRKTGKSVGWLIPEYKEAAQFFVEGYKETPGLDEELERLADEKAETETNARLRKIEERLVDVPVGDRMDNELPRTEVRSIGIR